MSLQFLNFSWHGGREKGRRRKQICYAIRTHAIATVLKAANVVCSADHLGCSIRNWTAHWFPFLHPILNPENPLGPATLITVCLLARFLILRFLIQRKIINYLVQVYWPTIITTIASWATFWMNYESSVARVTIGRSFPLSLPNPREEKSWE